MKITPTLNYPRDLIGYANQTPRDCWPDKARIAVQFVINYEEGGENCLLHGDSASEAFLSEISNAKAYQGMRHMNMESLYEYGGRAGFWRLHRLFHERNIPVTVFAVAMALERNQQALEAMLDSGWEVASHGYRWLDYQFIDEKVERSHLLKAIDIHQRLIGQRPQGWYLGRTSPNTLKLIVEQGNFIYSADSYADDLPYYDTQYNRPQLIIPYTLDVNDMRFATSPGFNCGDQFYNYLKDSFDVLYEEGISHPKMMSIGLHCRIAGRPGRIKALTRFIDHIQQHDRVWISRRIDIANHWLKRFPVNS